MSGGVGSGFCVNNYTINLISRQSEERQSEERQRKINDYDPDQNRNCTGSQPRQNIKHFELEVLYNRNHVEQKKPELAGEILEKTFLSETGRTLDNI